MKKSPMTIISSLHNDSKQIISNYLKLHSESSYKQYLSSIADIFSSTQKENVRDLTFNDYSPIYQKYINDEQKTTQDLYKESFFRYLYANDLIEPDGFNEIWLKDDLIRHFLKKMSDAEGSSKDEKFSYENSLSFSEILKIDKLLDQEFTKFDTLRMAFVWYLLFETECSVREILMLTSDDYRDGEIVTYKNTRYVVPDRYKNVFEHLSEKQYNGFKNLNSIVSKLGILAGVSDLKPIRIKNARKVNMIKCGGCNQNITNLSTNWSSVNNRIICVKCADSLKKKHNNIVEEAIEKNEIELVSEESLRASSVMFTFDELRSKVTHVIDYLKLHEFQMQIGKLGEAYVFEHELQKLKETPYFTLVDDSKAADPNNGYDILSYDDDGNIIFIEVKTTIKEGSDFYISQHEVNTARECQTRGGKYLIYRVGNILGEKEHITLEIINNILDTALYEVEPYNYKVRKKNNIEC